MSRQTSLKRRASVTLRPIRLLGRRQKLSEPTSPACPLFDYETRDVLLGGVLVLLDLPDLLRFGATCLWARELAYSDVVWQSLLRRVFSDCNAPSAVETAGATLGPMLITRSLYPCKLRAHPWHAQPRVAIDAFLALCLRLVAPPPGSRGSRRIGFAEPGFEPIFVIRTAFTFVLEFLAGTVLCMEAITIAIEHRLDVVVDGIERLNNEPRDPDLPPLPKVPMRNMSAGCREMGTQIQQFLGLVPYLAENRLNTRLSNRTAITSLMDSVKAMSDGFVTMEQTFASMRGWLDRTETELRAWGMFDAPETG
eukprot:TRINITY_DN26648_c0_g1_i1.p1 TRINITY_DN26648_c0_g1~~TRINITY_DN26648_c0_g1_i1.p1  ORF type:complete len:309 (+),score=35.69 TRINITY_DN26648_c0_g1_i1:210-1136(+)